MNLFISWLKADSIMYYDWQGFCGLPTGIRKYKGKIWSWLATSRQLQILLILTKLAFVFNHSMSYTYVADCLQLGNWIASKL